ncbi:hypothetical protein [uncultured Clostridium sp.]|uniref:hypothetical protein n=1 Tax=uncultured Clostridium sp. TaxID=59620 RepID=UPI0027DDFF8D|nr:hypothetical protein [uncultured Clostridium sp.]
MKKNLIKLAAMSTTATLLSGGLPNLTLPVLAAQEETVQNENNNIELKTTSSDSVEVTTSDAVELTDSVPDEIVSNHSDFFDGKELTIENLVDSVYEALDTINIKSNPDFTVLNTEKIKSTIIILNEIENQCNLSKNAEKSIGSVLDNYGSYLALSKDNGYIYISSAYTSEDYEELDKKVKEFLINYDFNNKSEDQFKTDFQTLLSGYVIEYNEDTDYIESTTNQTGYINVIGIIKKDSISKMDFSYEKLLAKKVSSNSGNSSSGGSSSGGGSGSSSSGGGSSSSSSKSTSSNSSTISDSTETATSTDSTETATLTNGIITKNGQVISGWQQINGKWYLANANGQALTGWQQVSGKWYYLKTDGSMATNWIKDINGKWYYLNGSGDMTTGWLKDTDGKWYYLNSDGSMKTGWIESAADGKWYHLNNSGAMTTGWLKDTDGKWYYLYSNGQMASNTTVNGYFVGSDGAWIN